LNKDDNDEVDVDVDIPLVSVRLLVAPVIAPRLSAGIRVLCQHKRNANPVKMITRNVRSLSCIKIWTGRKWLGGCFCCGDQLPRRQNEV
jgi:hypothetical protein